MTKKMGLRTPPFFWKQSEDYAGSRVRVQILGSQVPGSPGPFPWVLGPNRPGSQIDPIGGYRTPGLDSFSILGIPS